MTWLPGSECLWGGMSKAALDCPRDAVMVATRLDAVDGVRGPEAGVIAVPVCEAHATSSGEWELIDDQEAWEALADRWPDKVWLMVREDSLHT